MPDLKSNRGLISRFRSFYLRGGKLTKSKGRVTSYAPSIGMVASAVALSGTISTILPESAYACTDKGNGTYQCDGSTSATNFTNVTASPLLNININVSSAANYDATASNASGLNFIGDSAGMNFVDSGGAKVNGTGGGLFLRNDSNGTGDVTASIGSGSQYTTTGGRGLFVQNSSTNSNNLTVNVAGYVRSQQSGGVLARLYGKGSATATIAQAGTIVAGNHGFVLRNFNASGEIALTHRGSVNAVLNGIDLRHEGSGDSRIDSYGNVTTGGTAIKAEFKPTTAVDADIKITVGGGTIKTTNGGHGVMAKSQNTVADSQTDIILNGAATISTQGSDAYGLYAITEKGVVNITMSTGSVTTSGDGSTGIRAENEGSGKVVINMSGGSVTASGNNADGIYAKSASGTYDIDITGGTVTSGSGTAAGIHTPSANGGTIDIGKNATVDGSASGVAIRDGDGNTVITNYGNVTEDAIMGLGNDRFVLAGGDFDGDIYGDNTTASNQDGDDTFIWTAGNWHSAFYGGNGSDTVLITAAEYDGSHLLDGGDDASFDDGWIDVLTIQGVNVNNGGRFINWEIINLESSTFTGQIEVGAFTVCDDSITLLGDSKVGSLLGCESNDTFTIKGNSQVELIEGAGGADLIEVLENASVDVINLAGSGQDSSNEADKDNNQVTINTTGSVGSVLGGENEDSLSLQQGTITDGIYLGGGSDKAIIADGFDYTGATLDGGENVSPQNNDRDTLTAGGKVVDLNGANVTNWEVLNFDPEADATLTDMLTQVVNAPCGGSTTLTGASSVSAIIGCEKDETVQWLGGNISDGVYLDDGSDTLVIAAGVDYSGVTLDGGDDASSSEGMVDTLTVGGDLVTLDGDDVFNWEVMSFDNDALVSLINVETETVNAACNGSTTLTGSSKADTILGCANDDTIILTDMSEIDVVEGAGGSDTIAVLGGASVGLINVASAGQDDSETADSDGNRVIIDTSGTVGTVLGGAFADAFEWHQGNLTNGIYAGLGADTLIVDASAYNGSQTLDGGGEGIALGDDAIDRLVLRDITATAAGTALSGWEVVTLDASQLTLGDGAWFVGNGAAETGVYLNNGSSLDAHDRLVLAANLTIDATSQFLATGHGVGVYEVSGSIRNDGQLDLSDGVDGDIVTVDGNYAGDGQLNLDINFNRSSGDKLVIQGDVTGGSTRLRVNDVGSDTGSYTGPNAGILVVAVGGDAESSAFSLESGVVKVGAFDYTLNQFADGDFYLSSNYQSGVATIEALGGSLMSLLDMPTMQQRVGNRNWLATVEPYRDHEGFWLTVNESRSKLSPVFSTTQSRYQSDLGKIRVGFDMLLSEEEDRDVLLSVFAHTAEGDTDVSSALTDGGSINHDLWGAGAALTWYRENGWYSEGQLHYNSLDNDLFTHSSRTRQAEMSADGWSGSIELGYRWGEDRVAWIPQAQLTYASMSLDAFDLGTMQVDSSKVTNLQGRLGLALSRQTFGDDDEASHFYGIVNLVNDFDGHATMQVSGTPIESRAQKRWGEVGLGFTHNFNERFSMFGEASYEKALSDGARNYRYQAQLGLRFVL